MVGGRIKRQEWPAGFGSDCETAVVEAPKEDEDRRRRRGRKRRMRSRCLTRKMVYCRMNLLIDPCGRAISQEQLTRTYGHLTLMHAHPSLRVFSQQ